MIYDSFQRKAIDHIKNNHSVIVSAPTGAGKTAIAEYVIEDCLRRNKSAIYTAPIKALSNQKFRDFSVKYPGRIGILTGDVTINSSASILIMTTEIFRNKILEKETSLEEYSWIIYDEIHYLDDYERGTVWEESLMFLPPHMKVLALSATIPNIEELAEWIQSVHQKPFEVVVEENRPVPLHFFYQCEGEIVDELQKVKELGYKHKMTYYSRGRKFSGYVSAKPNRPTALIKHLFESDRLPCLYFSFGRRRCESLAEEMYRFDLLNAQEKEKMAKDTYGDVVEKIKSQAKEEAPASFKTFVQLRDGAVSETEQRKCAENILGIAGIDKVEKVQVGVSIETPQGFIDALGRKIAEMRQIKKEADAENI